MLLAGYNGHGVALSVYSANGPPKPSSPAAPSLAGADPTFSPPPPGRRNSSSNSIVSLGIEWFPNSKTREPENETT